MKTTPKEDCGKLQSLRDRLLERMELSEEPGYVEQEEVSLRLYVDQFKNFILLRVQGQRCVRKARKGM